MSPFRTPAAPAPKPLSLNEARAKARWERVRARRRAEHQRKLMRKWGPRVVGAGAAIVGIFTLAAVTYDIKGPQGLRMFEWTVAGIAGAILTLAGLYVAGESRR